MNHPNHTTDSPPSVPGVLDSDILRQANDSIPMGQIIVDEDLRICTWNLWMQKVTGKSAEEIKGVLLEEAFEKPPPARVLKILQECTAKSQSTFLSSLLNRCPFPLRERTLLRPFMEQLVSASSFKAEDGRRYVAISIQDVSGASRREQLLRTQKAELQETGEKLQEANAQLSSFVHTAAHDLRAPLRQIVSCSEMLQSKLKNSMDAEDARTLGFVQTSAKRLQKLVRSLLNLAFAENANARLTRVSLQECIRHAIDCIGDEIESSNTTIRIPFLPAVTGDFTLLSQVFQNLIGNAIKYRSDLPPEVEVTFEKGKSKLIIGISDNGIGIDPAEVDDVFLPFHRLESGHGIPGSGIGLSICRKAIDFHGGKIWIEPGLQGCGTHFRFTLPKMSPISEPKTDLPSPDSYFDE